jgi:NhaA family Na+:H+ antiporter
MAVSVPRYLALSSVLLVGGADGFALATASRAGRAVRLAPSLHSARGAGWAINLNVSAATIPKAEERLMESMSSEGEESSLRVCEPMPHWVEEAVEVVERGTIPGAMLIAATVISLSLANIPATSAAWLGLWQTPLGPHIGGHALSLRAWINEGLMAIFFFVVGLEIKQELRLGSLASVKKAVLPCLAALGGMVTPMGMYLAVQRLMPAGSLVGITIPMATDIAFAMAVFGFFRSVMPLASSAFLLTLATVDDLGAILVLATCFASNVCFPFLGGAAALLAAMAILGKRGGSDMRIFSAGGAALWWCLLRSGINSDVAGVLAALCISTSTFVAPKGGEAERLTERAIKWILPFSSFLIMPLFALANTAVQLGGSAAGAVTSAASVPVALGISAGLLLGKPLGIFGFTWLADKLGIASMPAGMTNSHLAVVGMLGGIGFTMCLLLTEVALPAPMRTIPKLAVLASSGIAAVISALMMSRMKERPKAA